MRKAVDAHFRIKIKGPAVGRRNKLQGSISHRALKIIVRQRQQNVPPEKEARKGDAAGPSHQLCSAQLSVAVVGPHTGALQPLSLLIHHPGRMKGENTVRMGLHVVHLPLQLAGIAPVVIAVQHRHIFARCPGDVKQSRNIHLPLTVLVLGPENGTDDVRVAAVVRLNHFLRTVNGGIIVNQNLQPEIPLLSKDTVEAFRNIRPVIVGHHTDADLKGVFFFHHINRNSPMVRCSRL